ncbi:16429_t:CDS:2 [Dentiscutata erythropus]|uniref:16429_t:CDS:1 n=1 Tax=Dentiscutata erythropus TaxID=1348616 RepID=A0A9N9I1I6_9GLOM|nr:16429_t:CDS:2 [Dentiscutata erythropus]
MHPTDFVRLLPSGLWSLEAYVACRIMTKETLDIREVFKDFYTMLEEVAENSEETSSKASSLIEAKRTDTKNVNKILDGSKDKKNNKRKYGEYSGVRQFDNAERQELPRKFKS